MEFFDIAYIWLAPLLILISFFVKDEKRKFALNCLAVINVLLIFHSVFIIRQFYAFVQMALALDIKPDPNQKIEIGWNEIKTWLIILLPFFFLIKRISANRILSFFVWFLLVNDWLKLFILSLKSNWSLFESHNFYVYNLSFKIINYISWMIFMYALFWFINKLPYQQKTIHYKQ